MTPEIKFILCETKLDFTNALANGQILQTYIVFIKETKEVWTHGDFYSGEEIDEVLISAGVEPVSGEKLWIDLEDTYDFLPIEDAPSDGKIYGRQDGEWVETSAAVEVTTETVILTVSSSEGNPDPNMNGVKFRITTVQGAMEGEAECVFVGTYNGASLTATLPCNITYYVYYDNTNSDYTYTLSDSSFLAVAGNTRTITLTASKKQKETVTINIISNQSNPDANLSGTSFTIKDSSNITVYQGTWSGVQLSAVLEPDESYSITYSTTKSDNYSFTLSESSFTATAGNIRNITLSANATQLTVTRTASDSASLGNSTATIAYNSKTVTANFTNTTTTYSVLIPLGSSYTITPSAISGYSLSSTTITGTATGVTASATITYTKVSAVTVKFVDSDGSNELEVTGDTSWIKGKRCVIQSITSSGVTIKYCDENNSELYADGTSANISSSTALWMTDIPEYWYTMDETTSGTHILKLSPVEQSGWKHSRRVLVGVTEAVNTSSKLYSKKGGTSTGNLTSVTFHNYATAHGSGFDIIDYETHCKIAHLFYAKYANRNPQTMTQFGYGESSYTRTIGTTSSLGNNDGKTSTQISFLGIEDFYGGKYEWMSGIHCNGGTCYIYDGFEPDGVPTVDYRAVTKSQTDGYISKVLWGEYADMVPTETNGSSTTHYCDYAWCISGWRVVSRSYDSAYDDGGVAYFDAYDSSSDSNSYSGSRLQYRGNITVVE